VLWLAALNNLVGTRSVGAVAVATTVLKITALAIVAVAGLLAFHAGHLGPVRAHGGSWTALPSASALLLFSFLGMESAAVATNRVRDPERNVPRAIIAGVAGVAVLYLAGTLAVQARCRRRGSPNPAPRSPTPIGSGRGVPALPGRVRRRDDGFVSKQRHVRDA